jgi:hypothetical protein
MPGSTRPLARLVSLQEYERVRAIYSPPTHSCVTYGPYVTQNRKEGPHTGSRDTRHVCYGADRSKRKGQYVLWP